MDGGDTSVPEPQVAVANVPEKKLLDFMIGHGAELSRAKALPVVELFSKAMTSHYQTQALARVGSYFLKLATSEFVLRKFPGEDSGSLSFKVQSFVRDDAFQKFYLDYWRLPEHLFNTPEPGQPLSIFDMQAMNKLDFGHHRLLKVCAYALIACIALKAGLDCAAHVLLLRYFRPALEGTHLWMSDVVMIRKYCPTFKYTYGETSAGFSVECDHGGMVHIEGLDTVRLHPDCGHCPGNLKYFEDKNTARMHLFAVVARLIFRFRFRDHRTEPGPQDDRRAGVAGASEEERPRRHCQVVSSDGCMCADEYADTWEKAEDGAIYCFLKSQANRAKNRQQRAGAVQRPALRGSNGVCGGEAPSKPPGEKKQRAAVAKPAVKRSDLSPPELLRRKRNLWGWAKKVVRTPYLLVHHQVLQAEQFPSDGWVSFKDVLQCLTVQRIADVEAMQWTPQDVVDIVQEHDTLGRFALRSSAGGDWLVRAGWCHNNAMPPGPKVDERFYVRLTQDDSVWEPLGLCDGAGPRRPASPMREALAGSWAELAARGLPEKLYVAKNRGGNRRNGKQRPAGIEVHPGQVQVLMGRGVLEERHRYAARPEREQIDKVDSVHYEVSVRGIVGDGWVLRRQRAGPQSVCLLLPEDNGHMAPEDGGSLCPIAFKHVTQQCSTRSGAAVWSRSELHDGAEQGQAEPEPPSTTIPPPPSAPPASAQPPSAQPPSAPPPVPAGGPPPVPAAAAVPPAAGPQRKRAGAGQPPKRPPATPLPVAAKKDALLGWVRAHTEVDATTDGARGDAGAGTGDRSAAYTIEFPQGYRREDLLRAAEELEALGRAHFCRVEVVTSAEGLPLRAVFRKGMVEGLAARLLQGLTHLECPRGYSNMDYLRRALCHRSVAPDAAGDGENLERQEFLGDAVVDFCVCVDMYHAMSSYAAGQPFAPVAWEDIEPRVKLLLQRTTQNGRHEGTEKGLRKVCLALLQGEFEGILRASQSMSELTNKAAADVLEAILGGIYLDPALGLHRCHDRVRSWFLDHAADDPGNFYSDENEWTKEIRAERRGGWVDARRYPLLQVPGHGFRAGGSLWTDRDLESARQAPASYGAAVDTRQLTPDWILHPWPRMQTKYSKTDYSTHFKFTGMGSSYRRCYSAHLVHHRMLQAHERRVIGYTNETVSPITRLAIDLDGIDANVVRFPYARPGQSVSRILHELVCGLYPQLSPILIILDISRSDKSSQHLHWPSIVTDIPRAIQVLRYIKYQMASLDEENDAAYMQCLPEEERVQWLQRRLHDRALYVSADSKGATQISGQPKARKCIKCRSKAADRYTKWDPSGAHSLFLCDECCTTADGRARLGGRTLHSLQELSMQDLQALSAICLHTEWSDFVDEACYENGKLRMYLSDKFDEDLGLPKRVPVHQSRVLLPASEGSRPLFVYDPGRCEVKAFPEIAEPVPHSIMQELTTLRHPCWVLDAHFCQEFPSHGAWNTAPLPTPVSDWIRERDGLSDELQRKWVDLCPRVAELVDSEGGLGAGCAGRRFGLLWGRDDAVQAAVPLALAGGPAADDGDSAGSASAGEEHDQGDADPDEVLASGLPTYRSAHVDVVQIWEAATGVNILTGQKREVELLCFEHGPESLSSAEREWELPRSGDTRQTVYLVLYHVDTTTAGVGAYRAEVWLSCRRLGWAERSSGEKAARTKAQIESLKRIDPYSAEAYHALLRWRRKTQKNFTEAMRKQLLDWDTDPGLIGEPHGYGATLQPVASQPASVIQKPRPEPSAVTTRVPVRLQKAAASSGSGFQPALQRRELFRPGAWVKIDPEAEAAFHHDLERQRILKLWDVRELMASTGYVADLSDNRPHQRQIWWQLSPHTRRQWVGTQFLIRVDPPAGQKLPVPPPDVFGGVMLPPTPSALPPTPLAPAGTPGAQPPAPVPLPPRAAVPRAVPRSCGPPPPGPTGTSGAPAPSPTAPPLGAQAPATRPAFSGQPAATPQCTAPSRPAAADSRSPHAARPAPAPSEGPPPPAPVPLRGPAALPPAAAGRHPLSELPQLTTPPAAPAGRPAAPQSAPEKPPPGPSPHAAAPPPAPAGLPPAAQGAPEKPPPPPAPAQQPQLEHPGAAAPSPAAVPSGAAERAPPGPAGGTPCSSITPPVGMRQPPTPVPVECPPSAPSRPPDDAAEQQQQPHQPAPPTPGSPPQARCGALPPPAAAPAPRPIPTPSGPPGPPDAAAPPAQLAARGAPPADPPPAARPGARPAAPGAGRRPPPTPDPPRPTPPATVPPPGEEPPAAPPVQGAPRSAPPAVRELADPIEAAPPTQAPPTAPPPPPQGPPPPPGTPHAEAPPAPAEPPPAAPPALDPRAPAPPESPLAEPWPGAPPTPAGAPTAAPPALGTTPTVWDPLPQPTHEEPRAGAPTEGPPAAPPAPDPGPPARPPPPPESAPEQSRPGAPQTPTETTPAAPPAPGPAPPVPAVEPLLEEPRAGSPPAPAETASAAPRVPPARSPGPPEPAGGDPPRRTIPLLPIQWQAPADPAALTAPAAVPPAAPPAGQRTPRVEAPDAGRVAAPQRAARPQDRVPSVSASPPQQPPPEPSPPQPSPPQHSPPGQISPPQQSRWGSPPVSPPPPISPPTPPGPPPAASLPGPAPLHPAPAPRCRSLPARRGVAPPQGLEAPAEHAEPEGRSARRGSAALPPVAAGAPPPAEQGGAPPAPPAADGGAPPRGLEAVVQTAPRGPAAWPPAEQGGAPPAADGGAAWGECQGRGTAAAGGCPPPGPPPPLSPQRQKFRVLSTRNGRAGISSNLRRYPDKDSEYSGVIADRETAEFYVLETGRDWQHKEWSLLRDANSTLEGWIRSDRILCINADGSLGEPLEICEFYQRNGRCRYAHKCKYSHDCEVFPQPIAIPPPPVSGPPIVLPYVIGPPPPTRLQR